MTSIRVKNEIIPSLTPRNRIMRAEGEKAEWKNYKCSVNKRHPVLHSCLKRRMYDTIRRVHEIFIHKQNAFFFFFKVFSFSLVSVQQQGRVLKIVSKGRDWTLKYFYFRIPQIPLRMKASFADSNWHSSAILRFYFGLIKTVLIKIFK